MLQELATLEVYDGPSKVPCKDLTAAEGYPINSMKRTETKYGPSIMIEIVMPEGETAITFLPRRFVDQLTNQQIDRFNKGGFKIRCTGMTGRSPNVKFFM